MRTMSILATGLIGVLVQACSSSPSHWVTREESLTLDAAGIQRVQCKTHNGSVKLTGAEDSASIHAHVTIRAGGNSPEDAQAAMDHLTILTHQQDGTQVLGWKWEPDKRRSWGARVSFEITAPGHLASDLSTHNGNLQVLDTTGDSRVESHNGNADLRTEASNIYCETHNGDIEIDAPASDFEISTHNGTVQAALRGTGPVSGSIVTHNGSVTISMHSEASTTLHCQTHNGRLRCEIPDANVHTKRRDMTVQLGRGQGSVRVETHNGSVEVR